MTLTVISPVLIIPVSRTLQLLTTKRLPKSKAFWGWIFQ